MRESKTIFTKAEFAAITNLVRLLEKSSKYDQKGIRARIRRLGLYWSEVADRRDYTEANLQSLVRCGIIKVLGYQTATPPKKSAAVTEVPREEHRDALEIEDALFKTPFFPVGALSDSVIPDEPGLYCIKIRKGFSFPRDFGTIRPDGIIYIGMTSDSLRQRLWEAELNCNHPATFFRSIGAMLGFLPPKGSLKNKTTRNYKFSLNDEKAIREWMRESLLVNYIPLKTKDLAQIEKKFIKKYTPLVNIQSNPQANKEVRDARERCVRYAKDELP